MYCNTTNLGGIDDNGIWIQAFGVATVSKHPAKRFNFVYFVVF